MGQSWLLNSLGLGRSPVTMLGGLLYLLAGAALVAAGLGLLGWIIPSAGRLCWRWQARASAC
jgi:hypothetical protein